MQIKQITYTGNDEHPLFAGIAGAGPPIIMLHGGGPDRKSIIPFAEMLQSNYQVIFPDIRGYGQSICFDKAKHTWEQYAQDVISLADHLNLDRFIISGMGLGASVAERVAFTWPERIRGVIGISPETLDKEGQGSSQREKTMMDKCAEVAITHGLEEAWKPFMAELTPVIVTMVREAFPRTNPESFAAAMAIVHCKRLESSNQLSNIQAPTLIIPGEDARHPSDSGKKYAKLIPNSTISTPLNWSEFHTTNQLASEVVHRMLGFMDELDKHKH